MEEQLAAGADAAGDDVGALGERLAFLPLVVVGRLLDDRLAVRIGGRSDLLEEHVAIPHEA